MNVLLIADDLTGAADSGVQLVGSGIRTRVLLPLPDDAASPAGGGASDQPEAFPESLNAIAVDTDSRHLPPEAAAERVRAACEALPLSSAGVLVKKIDSTLRGNVGRETEAVLGASDAELALLTPAYPEQERTVRAGLLYVAGRKLEKTEFASSLPSPDAGSSIAALLRRQTRCETATIDLDTLRTGDARVRARLDRCAERGARIVVCDAETGADLRRIVRCGRHSDRRILWVGSAGLVDALAAAVGSPTGKTAPQSPARNQRPTGRKGLQNDLLRSGFTPRGAGVLFVVGSLHPRSRGQLDRLLRDEDVTPLEVKAERLLVPENGEEIFERLSGRGHTALRTGRGVALYTTPEPVAGSEDADRRARIAAGLGKLAARLARAVVRDEGLGPRDEDAPKEELPDEEPPAVRPRTTGLFLTGGETARAVCRALGIFGLDLLDELEDGVPVCRSAGHWNGSLITKAGGFGSDDVMVEALRRARET